MQIKFLSLGLLFAAVASIAADDTVKVTGTRVYADDTGSDILNDLKIVEALHRADVKVASKRSLVYRRKIADAIRRRSLTRRSENEPDEQEVDENENELDEEEADENENEPDEEEADENENEPDEEEADENENEPDEEEADENENEPDEEEADENENEPDEEEADENENEPDEEEADENEVNESSFSIPVRR